MEWVPRFYFLRLIEVGRECRGQGLRFVVINLGFSLRLAVGETPRILWFTLNTRSSFVYVILE